MVTEVALITISCVLFVQMGLSEAIFGFLHVSPKIASCPKCCTFWVCLIWLLAHKNGVLMSVSASFVAAYAALWLALLYDSLALIYNYLYEQITKTSDTSPDAERPDSPADIQAGGDEVS